MVIRKAIVAGQFYPGDAARCRAELRDLLRAESAAVETTTRLIGGLVPHAGWICSGAVAGKVFAALAATRQPSTIILLGGVHRYGSRRAAVFSDGVWETPLGHLETDSALARRVLEASDLFANDPRAHESEHSLEVQAPFIKHLFPSAKILPIMVPSTIDSDKVGRAVAVAIEAENRDAIVVGTTDLTHYGPDYGFMPHGLGREGNRWAKDANDPKFIELVCAMRFGDLVAETTVSRNACSSGAAAATVAACAALGATQGVLLDHTSSSEVLSRLGYPEGENSVGYAGIVFK